MKYELVIFDSDGTLADTLPWIRSIFNDLARKHRFRVLEPHEFQLYRNLNHRELMAELGIPLWKVPRVVTSVRRMMVEHAKHLNVYPGVIEMLAQLGAGGVRLGVVSSNSADNVRSILGEKGASLIHHYHCGASMFGKAAMLRSLVRKTGKSAARALYIGDELRDLEAARKVGMGFGAVTWGQHEAHVFDPHRPDEMFYRVEEIALKVLAPTREKVAEV